MNFVRVTLNNVQLYQEMYVKYINNDIRPHSSFYRRNRPSEEILKEEALTYFFHVDFNVYLICNDVGDFVGFCIFCNAPSQYCPPTVDCHIAEFYISEEYRRHGYGSQAVNMWLSTKAGKKISLHILKSNQPAIDFWNSIFVNHSALADFSNIDEDYSLYTFAV